MTKHMTPSRHQNAEDARHWKKRLYEEEEREAVSEALSMTAPSDLREVQK